MEIVKEGQDKREKNGLGRAVIAVFGVGSGAAEQAHLGTIGKEQKGGFFVEPLKKPKARGPQKGPKVLQDLK